MEKQFVIAGFGGQGVLLLGTLIAKAALLEDREVSWMPSYGPEMRGGEANCAVVVSDEPIASPMVSEPPVLVAMNKPSLMKFTPNIPTGGTLLYNASIISGVDIREDIHAIAVPCNEIAEKLGNSRVANMVMLGAMQAATGVVSDASLRAAVLDWLGEGKAHMLGINEQAIEEGRAAVRELRVENRED